MNSEIEEIIKFNKFIRRQFGGDGEEQTEEQPIFKKPIKSLVTNLDKELTDTIENRPEAKSCDVKFGKYKSESEYLLSEPEKEGEPEAPDMAKLFADDRAAVELTSRKFLPLTPDKQKSLLKHKLPIHRTELNMIVDQSALEHVIETEGDEKSQGDKIIAWLKSQFQTPTYQNIINGLSLYVNNGYVHIVRDGLGREIVGDKIRAGTDIITEELLKKPLKYFWWQMGLPIDYYQIRDQLFKNDFQKQIEPSQEILKEAEDILSQEYLIAIQPEPDFLMWAVKRLIECWYGCIDLQRSIRKIKVLVNLYRARGTEEYNKKYGVLPMIVVYPNYGVKNAEIVIKNLLYFFFGQLNVGWECSQPTYFIKINSLFHYTNATLDLKLYYRNVVAASKESLTNQSFTDTFTNFKDASRFEDIESQIEDDTQKSKPKTIEVTKIQPVTKINK